MERNLSPKHIRHCTQYVHRADSGEQGGEGGREGGREGEGRGVKGEDKRRQQTLKSVPINLKGCGLSLGSLQVSSRWLGLADGCRWRGEGLRNIPEVSFNRLSKFTSGIIQRMPDTRER